MDAAVPEPAPQFATLVRVPDIELGGSTGAYVVEYNGARYVYKKGANIKHAINEYIAFQLYELVGIKVPTSMLVYEGENPVGFMLEYLAGQSAIRLLTGRIPEKEKRMLKDAVSKNYVFHALFANYDCNNSENYIVPRLAEGEEEVYYNFGEDGYNNNVEVIERTRIHDYENTYVIDLGGALFYRSKGLDKGEAFKPKSVPEIDSIAENTRTTTGKLFIALADSPALRHRIVCETWRSFDPATIPNFLQTPPIQALLIKYEMTGLTKIMKGRIEAIHKYCTEKPISSSLTEAELDALSNEISNNIETYKDSRNLEHIKDKLKGKPEVLSQNTGDPMKLLLVQAYDKNPALFHELLSLASKEALESKGSLDPYIDMRLMNHVINKGDYDTLVKLITKDVAMTIKDLNRVDIARIIREAGQISPKGKLFGRVHIAPYERFPEADIIHDHTYSGYLPLTKLNSVLDKQLLVKKPIHGFTEWMAAQEKYLKSHPRITAIVRAYTFRGDKLANSYLRGALDHPYDILNAIRTDAVVPFAYQIYDNYDFLVKNGLKMPAKETLMEADGKTIHHSNIRALYLANFDYFLRLHNIHKLIKDYCYDLFKIIQKAPPAPDTIFTYRGTQNEDHLKPGTYEYVNNSFVSTSIDPYVASSKAFTAPYFNTPMRFCVYEMELEFGSPCIFLKSVSHFSEDEILLPHNLRYRHNVDITLKYLCDRLSEFTTETDPAKLDRVFVRRLSIHGFSGRNDPKTFATNARQSKKKTKYSYVNSMHRKTARNPHKASKVANYANYNGNNNES